MDNPDFIVCSFMGNSINLKRVNKFGLFVSPGMKEVMVVKIAYQCSDMYADAMKLMQLPSLKDLWPRVGILVFSVQTCMLMP